MFLSQPGVCDATVLCIVPSEEVSDTFTCDTETFLPELVSTLVFFLNFSRMMQLYVSQPLRAGAAGKNPGQPPRSGEGLLQQRTMSVQLPHPNTAITQLQTQSSPLCQPSSFSVPKLGLCLLVSTTQMDM